MEADVDRRQRGKLTRWWRIWVVGGVDHDAILKSIGEESGWSGRYAFLIVVSAAISLLGLLMPSVAVLIGAMLLSPLMMPIIGLGFGIATLDFVEIRRTAIALVVGSIIAIVLSAVLVSMSPVQTITSEIAARTRPTLFDLLVALLSALAGAYALIRGRGGTVVGVAIAIALMPPLAVVGFGLATWNWTVFSGSLLLFLTNAVTIALTAALVARVYGFGGHLSPHHTGWQLVLFVAALGVLSIPLASALKQIAFEAVARRQIRDTVQSGFASGARLSQVDIDYTANPMRVRAVMLTPDLVAEADKRLATELQRRLSRPVDIHVDQLRISMDPGKAEAAQIARAAETSGPPRGSRERAIADLALITGAEQSTIQADPSDRSLRAMPASLPGLGLAGIRALEVRAGHVLSGWMVLLKPPPGLALPDVPVREGVVDGAALDLAAWASARTGNGVVVEGGMRAQREAVTEGIVSRGGKATNGPSAGSLRLAWEEEPVEESEAGGQ